MAAPLATDPRAPHFVLELHDPFDRQSIDVCGRDVPLEADLSTPLAYFLNQPEFQDSSISTLGLLRPGDAKRLQGLYMLEPFDPHKMPVVMVHGLWSSPITWMEMYNDLRSDPLVREYYQFWFYLYPTGQPFWYSATQMREDLAMIRRNIELETRLIDDLLDVTRITNGKLRLNPRPSDVHTLVRHVLEILKADVADKRLDTNELVVVQGHDHPLLMKKELAATDAAWVAGEPPAAPSSHTAKTRYRQADAPCTLTRVLESGIRVDFRTPQWAVTPGQSVVLYDGEVCLGGGVIT